MLPPFAFALSAFFTSKTWPRKTAWSLVLGLLTLSIFLTMSRGALFALGVVVLVFLLRTGMRKQILIPLVVVSSLLLVLPNAFFSRMEETGSGRASGRFDIWVVGAHILPHYGVVGTGLNDFRAGYNEYAGYAPVYRGFDRDPHDIYLQVWVEMGIVGVLLFGAAIYSQLRDAYKHLRQSNRSHPQYLLIASEALCWGLLAHGLGANLLWEKHFWLAWILLAVIVARPFAFSSEQDGHGSASQVSLAS